MQDRDTEHGVPAKAQDAFHARQREDLEPLQRIPKDGATKPADPVHAYVINLDRRTDRWNRFEHHAADVGLVHERVAAVDGADPRNDWLTQTKPGRWTGRPRTRIDHACTVSHWQCWRRFAESGMHAVIILEDDVIFSPNFADLIPLDWVPPDADIIKLETSFHAIKLGPKQSVRVPNRSLRRLRSLHPGAAAYVITRKALPTLMAWTHEFHEISDQMLFNPVSPLFHELVIYQLTPAAVIQGMRSEQVEESWADSSIEEDRKIRGMEVNWRTSKSAHGRFSDRLWWSLRHPSSIRKSVRNLIKGRSRVLFT